MPSRSHTHPIWNVGAACIRQRWSVYPDQRGGLDQANSGRTSGAWVSLPGFEEGGREPSRHRATGPTPEVNRREWRTEGLRLVTSRAISTLRSSRTDMPNVRLAGHPPLAGSFVGSGFLAVCACSARSIVGRQFRSTVAVTCLLSRLACRRSIPTGGPARRIRSPRPDKNRDSWKSGIRS